VPKDDGEAAAWFHKSAEQGYPLGQYNLAVTYEFGSGVPKDETQAVLWYRKAAEQGDSDAQLRLGRMYRDGRGVTQDSAEAIAWFRKAAERGDAEAQTNLGWMYEAGRGVAKDEAIAAQWYRKAADHGNPAALGSTYAEGHGVTKDEAVAAQWYRSAADEGDELGEYKLGMLYRDGRGVAKDEAQAVHWYRKAAERGFAPAQTDLGLMYRDGRGVAKDQTEAMRWLRMAAEQGENTAQAMVSKEERAAGLTQHIAELVKAKEGALPSPNASNPERLALTRELIKVSLEREKISAAARRFEENPSSQNLSKLPSDLVEAVHATASAAFRPDAVLALFERTLVESMDVDTLQLGLRWERSGVAAHISRLQLEGETPERRVAFNELATQFMRRGATVESPRERACAQVDILSNETEALLPLIEAFASAGIMAELERRGQPLDMAQIERATVALRPLLREATRQATLAACVLGLHDLTDAEFDQWLNFLRSDAGGRYARGTNAAMRDALLTRTAIFSRVLLEVVQQLELRRES
jgi:TPR repeat protein